MTAESTTSASGHCTNYSPHLPRIAAALAHRINLGHSLATLNSLLSLRSKSMQSDLCLARTQTHSGFLKNLSFHRYTMT